MNMIKKLAAATAVTCSAAGIGAPLIPAVASAASSSALARYNGACGSGYSVIDHFNVSGGDTGTVYLTWNNSNGYNCVATVRDHPGPDRLMGASVRVSGGTWVEDFGYYPRYAGPVYVYARGKCVDWGGGIDTFQHRFHSHCGR